MGCGGYDMNQYNIPKEDSGYNPREESWTCQIDVQVNEIISHTNELLLRLVRINEKLLGADALVPLNEKEAACTKVNVPTGIIEKILCNCKSHNARLAQMEYEVGRLEQL